MKIHECRAVSSQITLFKAIFLDDEDRWIIDKLAQEGEDSRVYHNMPVHHCPVCGLTLSTHLGIPTRVF